MTTIATPSESKADPDVGADQQPAGEGRSIFASPRRAERRRERRTDPPATPSLRSPLRTPSLKGIAGLDVALQQVGQDAVLLAAG